MSGRPHEAIVLFLDENLDSEVIVAALRAAGRHIERHRDHFVRGVADEEWLPVVAAHGWVILTRDARIRRVPSEREAMQRAGARLVIYRGHDDAATMAAVVLEAWPG